MVEANLITMTPKKKSEEEREYQLSCRTLLGDDE
jgi:hypothetical protein